MGARDGGPVFRADGPERDRPGCMTQGLREQQTPRI